MSLSDLFECTSLFPRQASSSALAQAPVVFPTDSTESDSSVRICGSVPGVPCVLLPDGADLSKCSALIPLQSLKAKGESQSSYGILDPSGLASASLPYLNPLL